MKRVLLSLVLVLAASALVFAGGQKDSNGGSMMKKDDTMMSDDKMSKDKMNGDDMSKSDDMSGDMMMFKKDDGMMAMDKASRVLTFTDLTTAGKHVKDGPTVLFFAASWCPDCRAMTKQLHDGMNPLSPDITLVVVDYDKYGDLKTKYGVTYQHTFVQIDEKGNKIAIWNAVDLDTINKTVVRGKM